jgi:two-component system response regulator MprA
MKKGASELELVMKDAAISSTASREWSMSAPRASILVVDDDDDVRDAIRSALADEGYEVACAGDGLEALDYLRREPSPELILLDMMMPRMDGAEFCAIHAEDPALAPIPVVLVTADMHCEQRIQPMETVSYLKKPVSLEELLSVVEKYCAKPDSTRG